MADRWKYQGVKNHFDDSFHIDDLFHVLRKAYFECYVKMSYFAHYTETYNVYYMKQVTKVIFM